MMAPNPPRDTFRLYSPHRRLDAPDTFDRVAETSRRSIHPASWPTYSVAILDLGGTVCDAPVAGPLARITHPTPTGV